MISIIIPCYNCEQTIREVLEPLIKLDSDQFEIICIDDNSLDKTLSILKSYKQIKVIKNNTNKGPSYSRNLGSKVSKGKTLIFLDADILITKKKIVESLREFDQKNIDASSAMLSCDTPSRGFFSTYKNIYMNYTFKNTKDKTDFIYGSFCIFKKRSLEPWPNEIRIGEDTALGNMMNSKGYELSLLSTEVVHLKRYSLFSLLKNDFLVPFHFSKTFIERKDSLTTPFSHTNQNQLISIATIAVLLVTSLAQSLFVLLFLFSVWIILNYKFFKFIKNKEDLIFALKSFIFTFIDQFIMGTGIFCGLTYYGLKNLFGKSKNKNLKTSAIE